LSNEIRIEVNGERRTAQSDLTVGGLLRELDIRSDRVAVELNLEVLDQKEFEQRSLRDGDRVEIISFIGGGI
jgi:thiamine biosynthesis protein ThiS